MLQNWLVLQHTLRLKRKVFPGMEQEFHETITILE